jgi:hypothetical protein
MEIIGIIKGLDKFGKLLLFTQETNFITNNEICNELIKKIPSKPFRYINDGIECNIVLSKYKEYYTNLIKNNIEKKVKVIFIIKKYNFDNHQGVSFLLKSIEFII